MAKYKVFLGEAEKKYISKTGQTSLTVTRGVYFIFSYGLTPPTLIQINLNSITYLFGQDSSTVNGIEFSFSGNGECTISITDSAVGSGRYVLSLIS